MTLEEMQEAAERQRLAMRRSVDQQLRAMTEAAERHRRVIAELFQALEALENPDVTGCLPDSEFPQTW